ncbi:hypothetical protein F5887DRAFT_25532 [Amanita rubescens]|nr:hypothetical protein F5887DRAFT_25532 [Amanita rubescens]
MNVLVKSFQSLQDDLSRRNETAQAADSIKALASVVDILKTSHIPETTFTKLTLILRSRMLPLYRIALKSALRYAAAVLGAISDIKSQNPDDVKQKESCDNAHKSLLSGVLDYLEQYQTNENQALVASALYPFLCREFFPLPDNAVGDVQDALLCTVFQVLSESAISHPGNQHKLRDPNVLGGKRLGLMLRQCKDFVALEALLELVGNIIPSAKKTERRNKFIQEVFDPKEFACSLEIVQLLERVSCTGWDATSTKIFDALAKLDSSYPQPFETTQIRIQRASYIVSRIYADKNAFIASVAEDGQFETFQLPFHAVKRIQVSSPSAFMATVTVSVSSSPLLGHSLIIRDKTDDMSIAFDLRKEKIRDFATILRKRELVSQCCALYARFSFNSFASEMLYGLLSRKTVQG